MKNYNISLILLILVYAISCRKDEENGGDTNLPTSQSLGFVEATSTELAGSEVVPELLMGTLPTSYFLNMPTPGNQGAQGSCVSWAVAYATQSYYMNKLNGTNYSGLENLCSPKYVYNQSKYYPNNCNGGSTYPAAFEILKTKGVCTLKDMPYNDTECNLQPNNNQNISAANNKILKWERVNKNDINNIKSILYSGSPIMIAVMVDESLDNLQTPYIWNAKYGNTRGGHALTVVGYDDSKSAFKVQNSWGTSWKDGGFFWISYGFFSQAVRNDECYVIYPVINNPSDNLTQGLVLNLPFNGNANDISGNNNNGFVNNATLVSDRKGNSNSAYQFGGFNNPGQITISSSNSLNFTNSISISFWLKINSSGGTDITGTNYADGISQSSTQSVFFKGINGNILYVSANHLNNFTSAQFGYSTMGVASKISDEINKWMHVVYVYSNNSIKMYKNGSLIWSVNSYVDVSIGNNLPLYIGKSYQPLYVTNGKPLNGIVDDIRIYNRVLNDGEVQKLYNL